MWVRERVRGGDGGRWGGGGAVWATALLVMAASGAGQVVKTSPSPPPPQISASRPPSTLQPHLHDASTIGPPSSSSSPLSSSEASFITQNNTAVHANVGYSARLPCSVRNLDGKSVSWSRRETVGATNYIDDLRYQAIHIPQSDDYSMLIKQVKSSDKGIYECQLSSTPLSSIFLHLYVIEWNNTEVSLTPKKSDSQSPVAAALQASVLTKQKPPDNHLTATFAPSGVDVMDGVDGTAIPAMFFATENNTAVSAQTGSNALLPCVIRNMDDGMVSWIRRKDRHLLTVGLTTYTSDLRYQAIHFLHSEDWTLQIKFVQKRDAGIYECQVSSHPPTSIFLQLNIVEAKAQISGPAEKYIKPGSALRLQCIILKTTEAPAYVFWYHNSRMINFDLDRGVNVSNDLAGRSSDLLIPTTGASHAGNYSCVPNNAQPASIYVHIFNGENPAAMQSGAECRDALCSRHCYITLIILISTVALPAIS